MNNVNRIYLNLQDRKFLDLMANLAFVLIYPLIYVLYISNFVQFDEDYSFFVKFGYAIAIVLFITISFITFEYNLYTRYHVIFIIFLTYCLITTLSNFLFDKNSNPEAVRQSVIAMFQICGTFAIGYYFAGKKTHGIEFSAFVATSLASIFLYVNSATVTYIKKEDLVFHYQGFADMFSFVCIFAFPKIRNQTFRFVSAMISIVVLFQIGARANFAALLVAFSVYYIFFDRKIVILLLFTGALFYFIFNEQIAEFFVDNTSRVLELIDLENSTSWQNRKIIRDIAIDQIARNPFFGDFGGNFEYDPDNKGGYSHDILSAYVTYGLIGFTTYLYLVISPIVTIFGKNSKLDQETKKLILLIYAFTAFAVFTAKAVFWPHAGLLFGVFAYFVSQKALNSKI